MNLLDFNNWIQITESARNLTDYSKNNLDVTQYRNGDPIPEVKDPLEWGKLTTGAWCHYNNNPENGILYNWLAVSDPRGLAPIGWKIPSIDELNNHDLSKDCKNGIRSIFGEYKLSESFRFLWSSTSAPSSNSWYQLITTSSNSKEDQYGHPLTGLSVRCIPDIYDLLSDF